MALEQRQLHVVGIGGSLRPQSNGRRALTYALAAAEAAGATTELLALNEWRLPMFEPGKAIEAYEPIVTDYLAVARRADAMIWCSAGYHGTITGVAKNALDFLEFLSQDDRAYLHQRVVGLIATAAGELAAVNTINAMVHVVHALRGTVAPLFVPIGKASQAFDADGQLTNPQIATRLEMLGKLVVDTANRFRMLGVTEAD